MAMNKSSEIRHVIVHWVTVTHVRVAVVRIFLVHKGVRVLHYLVTNSRVVLEISLQSRMVVNKISLV